MSKRQLWNHIGGAVEIVKIGKKTWWFAVICQIHWSFFAAKFVLLYSAHYSCHIKGVELV